MSIDTFAFDLLGEDARGWIRGYSEVITFDPGAEICAEGERGRRMYIIHEGSALVLKRDPAGGQNRIAVLEGNEMFGDMSMVNGTPYSATVVAGDGGCTVECVPHTVVRHITQDNTLLGFRFMVYLLSSAYHRLAKTTEAHAAAAAQVDEARARIAVLDNLVMTWARVPDESDESKEGEEPS